MTIGIVITLYRREEETKQVLDALLKCYNLNDFTIVLSHDINYADHEMPCKNVLALASSFIDSYNKNRKPGNHIWYTHNNPRKGIDLNKFHAIEYLLKHQMHTDAFILLEDDTVPAPDFLNYMATNLKRIIETPDILAVCAYNRQYPEEDFLKVSHDAYGTWLARGFNPWGWGMLTTTYRTLYGYDHLQYLTDTGAEANGRFDWWLSEKNLQCIRPVLSRTRLIGEFNAEHTTPADWEKEKNPYGAWDVNTPDNGLFTWDQESTAQIMGRIAGPFNRPDGLIVPRETFQPLIEQLTKKEEN